MPRRRFLDEAAPSDMTYNSIRPIQRVIDVKRKDTPARREKEAREYKARQEKAKFTPANPRQQSVGPYRQKTAIDKAGGKLYAEAADRVKQQERAAQAGEVLGAILAPAMPSSYLSMLDAYKRGEVNSVSDVLAAPYLNDSWAKRNPGKALLTDILTPIAGSNIAKSYKAMRAGLKNPVLGIIPDNTIASGFRYSQDDLNRINGRASNLVDLIVNNFGNGVPSTAVYSNGRHMQDLGSQANRHLHQWLGDNGLNLGTFGDAELQRYLQEYTQRGLGRGIIVPGFNNATQTYTLNSAGNLVNSGTTVNASPAASQASVNLPTSVQDAEARLEALFSGYKGTRSTPEEVEPIIDYLRNNKPGFDYNAEQQFFYNLGQRYGVNPMPSLTTAGSSAKKGQTASKVPILKEARRRKAVVNQNMAQGMTKEEAEAAERATRENIYWGNRQNRVIDFSGNLLSRKEYEALPDYAKVGGTADYDEYMRLYNTLANSRDDTMTSTYVRNDWGYPGALTGLDVGRFIEEAPHGERINIHSLSTDSYPAILQNLLRYGNKGVNGIKIQLHPDMTMFNGLGRRTWDDKFITTYDQIKSLTDQVNGLYGTSIPYPTMRGGELFERPQFTIFKYKYGGRVPSRRRYSLK